MDRSCLCIKQGCDNQDIPISQSCCLRCSSPLNLNKRYYAVRKIKDNPEFDSAVFEAIDTHKDDQPIILRVVYIDSNVMIEEDKTPPEEYFRREVDVLSQLSERNIDGIPKVEKESDFQVTFPNSSKIALCLPMEKIEGDDLDKYIQNNNPITEEQAISWMKQIAKILRDLYLGNSDNIAYYHRDIKPSNIIRRPDDKLFLIDLGSVCEKTMIKYDSKNRDTSKRTQIYTAKYSAPEQREEGTVNEQTELYALGKTFIFLLTGQAPSSNLSNIPVSQGFFNLLRSLTKSEPKERPKTIDEVMKTLKNIEEEWEKQKNKRTSPERQRIVLRDFITLKNIALIIFLIGFIWLYWTFNRNGEDKNPKLTQEKDNIEEPIIPEPDNPKAPTPEPTPPDPKCRERNNGNGETSFSAMAIDSRNYYKEIYRNADPSNPIKKFPPNKLAFSQSSCVLEVTVILD